MTDSASPLLRHRWEDLRLGTITRRQFVSRAAALGVATPVILALVEALGSSGASATELASGRPSLGTEGQVRGGGGELRIAQWQAPTNVSFWQSVGFREQVPASIVQEGLFSYAPDGTILPNLVTDVPTVANGGLSEDLRVVTLNLQEGLRWNDGEPVTSDDVVWTHNWVLDGSNAIFNPGIWEPIESIESITPTRFQVIFREGSLNWFYPLTGTKAGVLMPKHLWDGRDKETVNQGFLTNPIGTGPYKVESIIENDQVVYSINEHYRESNKPWFSRVILKGGGDPATAAQAVLQTGEADVAWNTQADPQQLLDLEKYGKGSIATSSSHNVERIVFNFSDPRVELDGERSNVRAPHPFLTDPAVRKAMALAIDREAIANQFYLGGDREPVAVNILTGIGAMESTNITYEFNIELANQILDDAGWERNGNVRSKDGVELAVTFNTTMSPKRHGTQAVIEQGWEAIGVGVQLGQIDEQDFFSDPSSAHFFKRFDCDVQMHTDSPVSPFPLDYMRRWYAGPGNANVAQMANDWQAANMLRYVNSAYDAHFEEAEYTNDAGRAAELFVAMNDIVVNECVEVPLVERADETYAISNRLMKENVAAGFWEHLYWNIANWRTVEG